MNMMKTVAIAATLAAGSFATTANAASVTVNGMTYDDGGAPFDLRLFDLEVGGSSNHTHASNLIDNGTSLSGNLNSGASSDGGGISFRFTSAIAGLFAVSTNTTNLGGAFQDLRISWCASEGGPGAITCVGEEAFIEEPVGGASLVANFMNAGDVKYLVATWSSVVGVDQNLDFKVVGQVPVPAAGLLLLAGLGGLGAMKRRKG